MDPKVVSELDSHFADGRALRLRGGAKGCRYGSKGTLATSL